jgi:hypothetical protein
MSHSTIPAVREEQAGAATLGEQSEATVGERGGATLVGFGLVGMLLMVGVVGIDIGALAAARAAAQTAADMAALAALTHWDAEGGGVAAVAEWGETQAAEIAWANGRSWCAVTALRSRRWSRCGAGCGSSLEG